MKITDVTIEDGRDCALLVRFMTTAHWELTTEEVETLSGIKGWLHSLAVDMATQLKESANV